MLSLNSGSSSTKFSLHRVRGGACDTLLSGDAELVKGRNSTFTVRVTGDPVEISESGKTPTAKLLIGRLARLLDEVGLPQPQAVAHRVVHGGPLLRRHCVIDDETVKQLKKAAAFAPLHTKAILGLMSVARRQFQDAVHIACFDTAFHSGLPEVARVLPIPKAWRARGIERYGFHGLSCESIVRQLGTNVPSRVIVAHLGGGASLTAIKNGRSIDTTMGLTPSGGVMMGSRTGDIDPGILLFLMKQNGLSASALDTLINHRSGLLGVSGLGSDVRALHAAAEEDPDAALALEMFCYSVSKHLAAMAVALEGVDLLVFTGGIGEHDAQIRARICERLSWAGVVLHAVRNRSVENPISDRSSRCVVRALPSRENAEMAMHAAQILSSPE
ncbi:MAG: acetate/propionate family kinase [Vicinamibacteria bacterium]